MNPLTLTDVDLILQQLDVLVSGLKKKADLLSFYTAFAFIDRLAESKRPALDLNQVEKLIVLLEQIYIIKHKSFPDVGSSYRSLRDVIEIMDSEVNTLATFYNFLRPQVVKLRRSLTDLCRTSFKHQTGEDYQPFGFGTRPKKESDFINKFWTSQFELSLEAFKQEKSIDSLDNIMACLPLWLTSLRVSKSSEFIELINNYLNTCDFFIDLIREMATSRLEQLPLLDPSTLQKEIELRDFDQINLLKQNISQIIIAKDLPRGEKAKLKSQKDLLNEELSTLLKKHKQEVDEKLHEIKKDRHKLLSLEKRAKVYRQNLTLRLEREVIKTLHYLISTYDLHRTKDPIWANAKKLMRKFFVQQISNPTN